MLLDETAFTEASCYRLTQTHDLDGHVVRVRVHRDFYLHQSWAVADVLTPALTWTELATAPAQDWHPDTHTPRITAHAAAARDTLQPIASDLTGHAQRLLRTVPAPAPARPGSVCAPPSAAPGTTTATAPCAPAHADGTRWLPPQ